MTDVARSAGVSQKTVSRVVNGEPHVSPAVRERVRREIERLGYRPNASARALVTRRTRRIGIVTSGTSYFGPAAVLAGLERAARRAGYFVSVVHVDERDEAEAARCVAHLTSQDVDAVAVTTPTAPRRLAALVPPGIPVLTVASPDDSPHDSPDDPTGRGTGQARAGPLVVGTDDQAGARAATEHLLGLGHRTVHHLAGPPGWANTRHRVRGWLAALRAAGAPHPHPPHPPHGDWSAASGHHATRELLATTPPGAVTALFVANDQMAIGAIHALQRAGRRVPDDVSVVGFDDIPEAAYLSVPLTTVRQDFDAVAEQAMGRLVAAVTGRPPPTGPPRVPVQLVVRDSTAAPAPRPPDEEPDPR